MSNQAANVLRIWRPDSRFGSLKPHSAYNLLGGEFRFLTTDQEDFLFEAWTKSFTGKFVVTLVDSFQKFLLYMRKKKVGSTSPIPGSTRWNNIVKGVM